MSFFGGGIFYGSGSFYIGAGSNPANGIPQDLRFYRTTTDGIYVFWWGFNPAFITPSLALANFDLELDTVNTFTSPNLVTFTSGSLVNPPITFQNGNVRKGFAVPVAARIDKIEQIWYARVRTHTPSFVSDWSAVLTWVIPQKVEQQYAENLMISLPDFHVYGKGDLLKPVNQRNSNLYLIEDMYGNQFDKVFYENFLTQTDNYVDMCRDEFLQENFGVLFNFPKPNTLQFVDYRWILMNLFLASLVGSTNEAIILTVQSFTGVPPAITNIRDEEDFFLITIQDPPVVSTAGQTVFHTSQPFIDATITLEQLSTLAVGSTTGFSIGEASDTTDSPPVSFFITSIISGTELEIASIPNVGGQTLNPGDNIVQGLASTTISSVTPGGFISSSNYTTDGVQGTWTMNSPQTAGTVFQAMFDVGNPNDPFPVIFDSLSGSTTLTGLVTFTNGNQNIGGFGTLFLTELSIGDEITDPNGIYIGEIDQITDNTHCHLLNTWKGPTEVNTAYRLLYTDIQLPPPILWDQSTLKAGVLITVFNPGDFILS